MKIDSKYYARELLKLNGFYFCIKPPYVSVSGLQEPIYHDHRLFMFYPEVMSNVARDMVKLIAKNYEAPDVVVGVGTGAIPYATLVAQKLDLPMAYVRANSKAHGRKKLVEGNVQVDAKAIIVEDVLVLGTSSVNTYKAVIAEGASVLGIVSIYNLKLDRLSENLNEFNLDYYSLYDLDVLMSVVEEEKYFNKDKIHLITKWRKNPYHFFDDYKENKNSM